MTAKRAQARFGGQGCPRSRLADAIYKKTEGICDSAPAPRRPADEICELAESFCGPANNFCSPAENICEAATPICEAADFICGGGGTAPGSVKGGLIPGFEALPRAGKTALAAAEAALVVVEGGAEAFGQLDLDLLFGRDGPDERGGDRGEEDDRHEAERDHDDRLLRQPEARGDVALAEHLDADEHQHDGEPDLEVVELLDHPGQQEVERAQAEDGEDVRRVDDERVGRDAEDGRDRVHREDEV